MKAAINYDSLSGQGVCIPLFTEGILDNSPNTIKRHKQHYHKYFETSVLQGMKVKRIDELLLEQECNRIVNLIYQRKVQCQDDFKWHV